MHIDSVGRGGDVVVLHGIPQAPDDLDGLVNRLARRWRVHLVHLPGYGREPARVGPHDLDCIEQELLAQLQTLAPAGYSVVGISGGSYRAFRSARRGTLEPRGIVALGPLPMVVQAQREAFREAIGALQAGLEIWPAVVDGLFTEAFARANPSVPARYLAQLRDIRAETVALELDAIASEPDGLERLREVSCPVYMRVGERDQSTPPSSAVQALEWLPRARLDVVANAGHLLHHEDHDATLEAVERALTWFERGAPKS